jgi:hypothetical protein
VPSSISDRRPCIFKLRKNKTHNWTSISKEEEEEEERQQQQQQQQDRLSCDARNLNGRLTETTRGSPGRKSDLPMSTP